MSERLLLWDQASSAYKVTEAGRTAVIEIELELHRAKKDDILNKIKSKGANKESEGVETTSLDSDGTIASYFVRLFFSLDADAKGLKATLQEVKQNLEFGGVTLEENLNRVLSCVSLSNEIRRLYSWLCELSNAIVAESRNQQKLYLESTLEEVENEFSNLHNISEKLISSASPGGDLVGKLFCIIYVLSLRTSASVDSVTRRPRPSEEELKRVASDYVKQRARSLSEKVEKDCSVESLVREIYSEYSSLRFLFQFKMISNSTVQGVWDAYKLNSTQPFGQFVYHSILESVASRPNQSQHLRFRDAVIVSEDSQNEQPLTLLLPAEVEAGASGEYSEVELLRVGLGLGLGTRDRSSGQACSTVNEGDVAEAIGQLKKHVGGDRKAHQGRVSAFTSTFARGLKQFVNHANVSVVGFPHSTSMKDLFHLHSKSMYLLEGSESLKDTIGSASLKYEVSIQEHGCRVIIDMHANEDTRSSMAMTHQALVMTIAKLSDCLVGEIKNAAEKVLRVSAAGVGVKKLVEEVKGICSSFLNPIFQALQDAHPVTQRKFYLQGVVAVIHGVLLKLKNEVKVPAGSKDLANGLQKSMELIRSCMENNGAETFLSQGDSNYHLYQSSLLRSELVLKLLHDSTASSDITLPDLEEWHKLVR